MYEVLTIISIIVGAVAIIIATIWGNKAPTERSPLDVSKQDQRIEFEEINHKILELNEYAQFMKDEMEKKHKELLFLYQLISDKENNLREQMQGFNDISSTPLAKSHENQKNESHKIEQSAPEHNRMVLQLFKEGYDVTEIAKKLDLGIGQVQLILKLYQ